MPGPGLVLTVLLCAATVAPGDCTADTAIESVTRDAGPLDCVAGLGPAGLALAPTLRDVARDAGQRDGAAPTYLMTRCTRAR